MCSSTLGVRCNAVVLPAGHELVAVNYPSQVDGRTRLHFGNGRPDGLQVFIKARRR